jgi:hypothetical protein
MSLEIVFSRQAIGHLRCLYQPSSLNMVLYPGVGNYGGPGGSIIYTGKNIVVGFDDLTQWDDSGRYSNEEFGVVWLDDEIVNNSRNHIMVTADIDYIGSGADLIVPRVLMYLEYQDDVLNLSCLERLSFNACG